MMFFSWHYRCYLVGERWMSVWASKKSFRIKTQHNNNMQNQKLKVSLGYNKYSDAIVVEITNAIIADMTGNAAFPTPPVPIPEVTTLQATFSDDMAAAINGGTQLTAKKNQSRVALLNALDANALYVQTIARFDLPMLLSSGYQSTSTNRARTQLDTPGILGLENDLSAQLVVRLTPVINAYAYEVQVKTGSGDWQPAGLFTQARRIILEGLTSGMTYTVQARAIGGVTGYSGWSDPSSHIVT
jgi:hypothetical protein